VSAVVVLAAMAATGVAAVRWLRVAQREHYLPGSATRFALRWWRLGTVNDLLWAAAVIGTGFSVTTPAAGLGSAAVVAIGPLGLGLRGRTSKLAWTRRLKTLAVVYATIDLVILGVGIVVGYGPFVAVVEAIAAFVIVDIALAITKPIERALGNKFVEQARTRLATVRPTVVAVTGSYGKTSTKGYIAHLVGATRRVVPSPASYNNRNGLAMAINQNLTPNTEVFIAEMGTYGRGEIAELCSWCPPDIAVITAIGPVHLERMNSEDNILKAKAEITEKADVVVLNTDDLRLSGLADQLADAGRKVVRCSANDPSADVFIDPSAVDAPPTNVACAVAVALELGIPRDVVDQRLATLPVAPNRLSVGTGGSGATVIDDTFNSNPAGTRAALAALARHGANASKRVVVTPGMVELGRRQAGENRSFARDAGAVATHLLIVGRTNREALADGAYDADIEVIKVRNREEATAWVRQNLGPGDAVLYENDLPDHFA
jgi:UDP-N-acetylmuramoyl-tripeptide--D-alanyl-D-alanine ligase